MEGTRVGSYEITEKLGKGGMAVVWKAVHTVIGKKAVVKVLRPEYSADQDVVRRFFNEAKATTLIEHPGIVEVFDFGFLPDNRAYIVMEQMNGESLSARRRRVGKMRVSSALRICRQVAGALRATHKHGIIHRDLKPDNVFLVPDEEVEGGERAKVLDFGVAKLGDRKGKSGSIHTQTGVILGTPAYMAPEQCEGDREIDPRADIYSLGCILYKLLTGRTPFVYSGTGNMIAAQLTEEPVPPSEHAPNLPAEVDEFVMRLLEKDPNKRPSDMSEVYEELRLMSLDLETITTLGDGVRTRPAPRMDEDSQVTTMTTMPNVAGERVIDPSDLVSLKRYAIPAGVILIGSGALLAFVLARGGGDDNVAKAAEPPDDTTVVGIDAGDSVTLVDRSNDEVQSLLDEARQLIRDENWAKAHQKAGKAWQLEPSNARAKQLYDQAKTELTAALIYGEFANCKESEVRCIAEEFAEIPESSVYYDRAIDRHNSVRDRFVAAAKDKAKIEAKKNNCDEVDTLLQAVTDIWPEQAFEVSCGDASVTSNSAVTARPPDDSADEELAEGTPPDSKDKEKEQDKQYNKYLSDAREASKSSQFERSIRLCEKALAIRRTSEATMVCAIASCNLASKSKAKRYIGRIRGIGRQNMIRQICMRNGVKLD